MRCTVPESLGIWLRAIPFLVLVGCGSGGGSGSMGPPGVQTASSSLSTMGNASFSVSAAPGVHSLAVTLTQINGVAPVAKPVAVIMNFTATTPGCVAAAGGALACTATVPAPIGNDVFSVTTYAGQNGTGTAVASTAANAVIVGIGKTNCVMGTPAPNTTSAAGATI
jgi:hypothetical protein